MSEKDCKNIYCEEILQRKLEEKDFDFNYWRN